MGTISMARIRYQFCEQGFRRSQKRSAALALPASAVSLQSGFANSQATKGTTSECSFVRWAAGCQ